MVLQLKAFVAVAGFEPTLLISACVVVLVSGYRRVSYGWWGWEASGDLSLHLRLSFASEPRTRMSRNSSLDSQAFVMRASTGNRLLYKFNSKLPSYTQPPFYLSAVNEILNRNPLSRELWAQFKSRSFHVLTWSLQLSTWRDRRLNQWSPTYLIWVDPWIMFEWPTIGNFDCGATRFQTSTFSCAEPNAYISAIYFHC